MSVISIPKVLRDKLGEEAAESLVTLFSSVDDENRKSLSTREDIVRLEGEIKLLRWMVGFVMAGILTLIMKAFSN